MVDRLDRRIIFGKFCVVTDERIPLEWRNSFCTTGSLGDTREVIEKLYAFLGKDAYNVICGCEPPDEIPHIITHIHYSEDDTEEATMTNKCTKCKREWPYNEYKEIKR